MPGQIWKRQVPQPPICEVQTMNNKVYEYESLIYSAGENGGAYVHFPYDIRKE